MREGGKAAAGGCSDVDFYGIPPYCHLCCYWDKNNLNKYGDDDEDEMPVFCFKDEMR